MKHPKFIIKDGNLILMKVEYHREIAFLTESDVENGKHRSLDIKGGGWFIYVSQSNKFILQGKSFDFGAARLEDIKQCVNAGRVYSNNLLTHTIMEGTKFEYRNEAGEITPLEYNYIREYPMFTKLWKLSSARGNAILSGETEPVKSWWDYEIYAKTKNDFKMTVWNGNHPVEGNCSYHTCKAGTRVRIWMVSRFGDVGITDNLINPKGYGARGIDADTDLYDYEFIEVKK